MAATRKLVNGVRVPLGANEAAAIDAQWANFEANRKTPSEQDLERLNTILIADGSPLRAVMEMFLKDRNDMARTVAELLGAISNATSLANLKATLPASPNVYTRNQFITQLQLRMRQ